MVCMQPVGGVFDLLPLQWEAVALVHARTHHCSEYGCSQVGARADFHLQRISRDSVARRATMIRNRCHTAAAHKDLNPSLLVSLPLFDVVGLM